MHKCFTKVGLVTVATLIGLASIACNQAGSGNGSSTDNTVAATVNGKNIMLAEVEKLITQQTQGQQTQLSPLQLAQARLQVLDSLIQREVLYQRAQKENLLPNEEQITTAINQQKQQGGMSEEDFQKQLKQQNLTNEGLREEARKDIAIKNLQEKYNGKITISDREVEDYYNNNRQQFVSARGVALAGDRRAARRSAGVCRRARCSPARRGLSAPPRRPRPSSRAARRARRRRRRGRR